VWLNRLRTIAIALIRKTRLSLRTLRAGSHSVPTTRRRQLQSISSSMDRGVSKVVAMCLRWLLLKLADLSAVDHHIVVTG
jgi:hypothetical protein